MVAVVVVYCGDLSCSSKDLDSPQIWAELSVPIAPTEASGCAKSTAWGRLPTPTWSPKDGFKGSSPCAALGRKLLAAGSVRPGKAGLSSPSPRREVSRSVLASSEGSWKSSWTQGQMLTHLLTAN